MKIYTNSPKENWICDRFHHEWNTFVDSNFIANSYFDSDIIWLLAGWCWSHIPLSILKQKIVIMTIHHIVPEKFTKEKQDEFKFIDTFVNAYHVPCYKTKEQVESLTSKSIYTIPFWVNQEIWLNKKHKKNNLRNKYGLSKDSFLIGSFQRDTEGHDLISPKLEKGPDLFCNAVKNFKNKNKNVEVVLAGWRRQYVINKLNQLKINYYYFKMPETNIINDLYNCLDLYIVASRYEGGPQAIVECAANKTPIISTPVGIAPEILSNSSLFMPGRELFSTIDTETPYQNVKDYFVPQGVLNFVDMFKEIFMEKYEK